MDIFELRNLESKLDKELKRFKVYFLEDVPMPRFAEMAPLCAYELRRVLTECVEIIFTYHNIKKKTFDIRAMIELMDQIIPTACVLGTSFWVFYVNEKTRICTCWEYNLKCLHSIDDTAKMWLSEPPVHYPHEFYPVVPNTNGVVYPKNVDFLSAVSAKHIDVFQEFWICNTTREKSSNYTVISMVLRFNFAHRVHYVPDNRVLVMDPSPVIHPYYGWALPDILLKMYPRYYKQLVVCLSQTPCVTLNKVHCYVQMVPSIKYDVKLPFMFSTTNNPLTHLDFEMVRDICKTLLFQCTNIKKAEKVSTFLSGSEKEYALLYSPMFNG